MYFRNGLILGLTGNYSTYWIIFLMLKYFPSEVISWILPLINS